MARTARIKTPGVHDVIVELARRTDRPVHEVEHEYAVQLDTLEAYATVKTFVSILAKRRTLEVLSRH
ncbi:MAG: DUF3562 domain-containing protein [Usitatibacter sp.]